MATYSAAFAVHKTLTPSSVDTVTLTGGTTRVEVVNRTGTADIYFTVGQPVSTALQESQGVGDTTTGPSAPTVGGSDCYVVPAVIGSHEIQFSASATVVELISSGAEAYSVIATNV